MTALSSLALEKAQWVLARECSPLGLMISPEGYPHVWARDSVITGLGASLTAGHEHCLRTSLHTLAGKQSELGAIPNNVSVATGRLDHTNAGSVDSNLWYIVGHYVNHKLGGDTGFLHDHWPSLEQALLGLRYQDSNGCGLLEVHEAADWADLLANRFNILYDNVLWYAALSHGRHGRHAARRRSALRRDGFRRAPQAAHRALGGCIERRRMGARLPRPHRVAAYPQPGGRPVLVKRPFFLPYVAFRDYGDYCDVFGNLLAILFGVANPAQEKRILDYLHQVGIAEPFPVRVLHPVLHPGNKDWREYYRNNNLNLPEQYHNGGIWPFVGGFYVAVLVKAGRLEEARRQLEKLAEINRLGVEEEWEFNEWCHGRTGRPMGYPHQAWSAGMYVYAQRCVTEGRVPVFDGETWTVE